jgi:hypothetical protein
MGTRHPYWLAALMCACFAASAFLGWQLAGRVDGAASPYVPTWQLQLRR